MNNFRPMLATLCKDVDQIKFPIIATPKIDGIRCFIHPTLGPVTRHLKPIPNHSVREQLSQLPAGLDGELIGQGEAQLDFLKSFNHTNTFQATTSAIMSHGGYPRFKFMVFDYVWSSHIAKEPYHWRISNLKSWYDTVKPAFVEYVVPQLIPNADVLAEVEMDVLEKGYEGLIYRTPDSPYKFGRSTWNQQWMVKIKRFVDREAQIIGYECLYHNANEAEINELGYQERSSHQENMVPLKKLGKLIVEDPKFDKPFSVGSGFTDAQRVELWKDADSLIGKTITYKYQNYGIKDVPRIPIFKGFRLD